MRNPVRSLFESSINKSVDKIPFGETDPYEDHSEVSIKTQDELIIKRTNGGIGFGKWKINMLLKGSMESPPSVTYAEYSYKDGGVETLQFKSEPDSLPIEQLSRVAFNLYLNSKAKDSPAAQPAGTLD